MSESRSGNINELTARIKDAVGNIEDHGDADGLMSRIRETIGKAGIDADTDPVVARIKDVAGQAEGKIDPGKLRQWIEGLDRDTLTGWLEEAKTLGAGAASVIEAKGEKLADRAPGAFDNLAGAAKGKLGLLTGGEGLISEEQFGRLKGQFKETVAGVTDSVKIESTETGSASKSRLDHGTGRG